MLYLKQNQTVSADRELHKILKICNSLNRRPVRKS